MKSRNLFIGILILFAGVVALLSVLGVFEFHWSIFWRLWPMLLVILGIAILPLDERWKALLLLVALAVGCLLYHIDYAHFMEDTHSGCFSNHLNWNNWHFFR